MALELKGLCPKRKRSKLGPTRYQPRCKRCIAPLPEGRHVGNCDPCNAEIFYILRAQSALVESMRQFTDQKESA
jgi:hypothetical protein